MATCWIAGCRGRVTWWPPGPSSAAPSTRPGAWRRTSSPTKLPFYPSAIRTYAPGAKHTATGFYNLVISTNRCERSHGYVKSRFRPMRGLKRFRCATCLFPALDGLQLVERDFVRVPPIGAPCTGGRSYVRARHMAAVITRPGRTL
jgi:hypothetical protein